MALKLYNTMGRTLQEFIPIKPENVGFYGCGPTVYNFAHIGNLRAYVFLDTLHRTFSFLNYTVNHVMNITDIGHLSGDSDEGEDKMVKTARERGQSVLDIAQFYTDAFFADLERLHILRPTIVCKATDHIPDMIALIERLEKNGHTYMAGGNLYFDVATFPNYGKLALLNLDDLKSGARIDIDTNKRNPYDFVLWFTKSKFENQALIWDSPWGKGYPGWHIECSAMSMKYLGENIDIHTGGIDHISIHHTNEIAQSEGATGKKWVNYWLHNEFLVIAKQKNDTTQAKMSKSSGNYLTLQSLIDAGYDPLDYRFFLLGGHYRSQLAFSWVAMDGAKNGRKSLLQRITKIIEQANLHSFDEIKKIADNTTLSQAAKEFLQRFTQALEDDLATPRAISELQTAVKDSKILPQEKIVLINKMDEVLGLDLLNSAIKNKNQTASDENTNQITAMIEQRIEAKKNKNYILADEIRNNLQKMGIVLEDNPSGTTWKRQL